MKPRTKRQKEVIELSKNLITYYSSLKKWGFDHCLNHVGYATKTRVLCMDCGERFSPDLVHRKRAVCPHCEQKLVIKDSKKRTMTQYDYFALAEVIEQYQVIRYYRIESTHKAGEKAYVSLYEVMQHWYIDYDKREFVSRNRSYTWYGEYWGGDLEIRKKRTWKENLIHYKIHPSSVFQERFKLRGFNHKITHVNLLKLMINIVEPKAETLLKAKQYPLLNHYLQVSQGQINRYWNSIKICMRNNYKVKDTSSYFDYLELLQFFGKDLHNAYYVCPKNFKKEHDRYVAKKRKVDKKNEDERKKREALKSEAEYSDFITSFKNVVLEKDNIVIKPLQSVEEFVEEGDDLGHCVFANEYFKKRDSIILSAKNKKDGKRIETIEFSLKSGKVIQSRGKFNDNTQHHEEILKLMESGRKHILSKI